MTIKLGLLDRWNPIGFDDSVRVALITSDGYNLIGVCNISINKDGNHIGKLELNHPVNEDLYLYYSIGEEQGIHWLYGLDLMDHQHKDRKTIQLKDAFIYY